MDVVGVVSAAPAAPRGNLRFCSHFYDTLRFLHLQSLTSATFSNSPLTVRRTVGGRKVLVNMSILWFNEGFTVGATSRNGRQLQMQRDEENSPVKSVFATPDLLQFILRPLIEGELLPLSSRFTVSKSFRKVTLSNQFWQVMCYQ